MTIKEYKDRLPKDVYKQAIETTPIFEDKIASGYTILALRNLGYKEQDIKQIVKQLRDCIRTQSTDKAIRAAENLL